MKLRFLSPFYYFLICGPILISCNIYKSEGRKSFETQYGSARTPSTQSLPLSKDQSTDSNYNLAFICSQSALNLMTSESDSEIQQSFNITNEDLKFTRSESELSSDPQVVVLEKILQKEKKSNQSPLFHDKNNILFVTDSMSEALLNFHINPSLGFAKIQLDPSLFSVASTMLTLIKPEDWKMKILSSEVFDSWRCLRLHPQKAAKSNLINKKKHALNSSSFFNSQRKL